MRVSRVIWISYTEPGVRAGYYARAGFSIAEIRDMQIETQSMYIYCRAAVSEVNSENSLQVVN